MVTIAKHSDDLCGGVTKFVLLVVAEDTSPGTTSPAHLAFPQKPAASWAISPPGTQTLNIPASPPPPGWETGSPTPSPSSEATVQKIGVPQLRPNRRWIAKKVQHCISIFFPPSHCFWTSLPLLSESVLDGLCPLRTLRGIYPA